jgi:uncharacterized protein with PQ loop repeat
MKYELFIKAITYVYFVLNTIRVFSYVPQIITVGKEKTTAKAISLWTWCFWTGANLITGMYATFVVKDTLLSLMSYGNTLGCGIVVGIVLYKRRKYDEQRIMERNRGIIEIASEKEVVELIRN